MDQGKAGHQINTSPTSYFGSDDPSGQLATVINLIKMSQWFSNNGDFLRHVGITMIKCRKRFMNNASSKYKVDYIDTALCGHFISIDAAFKRIWWGHKSLFSLPVDVLMLSITLLIRPLVVWERYERILLRFLVSWGARGWLCLARV